MSKPERPEFPINVNARIESATRRLAEIEMWLNRIGENNPIWAPALVTYRKANEIGAIIQSLQEIINRDAGGTK